MTGREAVKRLFLGGRSARIPRALFGAGLWAYHKTGLKIAGLPADPKHFAEMLADFFRGLDTDIIFPGSGLNSFPAEAIGGTLAFRGEQAPLLSLPLIQKTGDARYLREMAAGAAPSMTALIEMTAFLRQLLPDRSFFATSWGPFTWAMILCDWNLLRNKVETNRNFVREVCELGVHLSRTFFEPLSERGLIDGISVPEGAVTLIPHDLYCEVVLPCERQLFAWAKERGLHTLLHQCGNIGPQIASYPDSGVDCISVDTGVPIGDVYRLYRDRLITAGNVDVVNTIFGGDHAKISGAVSDCLKSIDDPCQRYILMPSCDLPPDTPIENVRTFLSGADGQRV